MKKTTATCTWALAAIVATTALLALANTSYADRGRDGDRGSWYTRDDRRDGDRSRTTGDRNFDRSRTWRDRPWEQFDRGGGFSRPPIYQIQVYVLPVRIITMTNFLGRTSCFGLGFNARW